MSGEDSSGKAEPFHSADQSRPSAGPEEFPPPLPSSGTAHGPRIALHGVLLLMSLVVLFPIYLVFVSAISRPATFNQQSALRRLYPIDVDWGSFREAFNDGGLARAMTISLLVTIATTLAQVVTSALAAYAYVFIDFPCKRLLFAASMATLLLPIEVTLLANVRTISDLGWTNSYQALIVPFAATAFGIFLLRQGFAGIPRDVYEAARLDGHGHAGFLVKFAVPLTRPIVGSFVLVSALSAWANYTWPRMTLTESEKYPLPIALRSLVNLEADRANLGAAGVLIAAVPVVVLLVVFQRQIIRGLTAGAVKG